MESSIFSSFESQLKTLIKQCIHEELLEFFKQHSATNPDGDLMYMKEAAAFLKMSVAGLYGHTQRRIIPFSKMGRRNVFSKKTITEWIMSRNQKTAEQIAAEECGASNPKQITYRKMKRTVQKQKHNPLQADGE